GSNSLRMTLRMQEKRYTSSLLSFFIYNPSFWPWEGEEKILFYHPSEVEKNEKIRNVGHCTHCIVQHTVCRPFVFLNEVSQI
uniref:CCZ1/INTU/HSP4 first Longin domain-containing protein n=1 Tax=Oncorhynchus kisutch TaxID=8019 RepID=A0A8C7D4C0_ONCKI